MLHRYLKYFAQTILLLMFACVEEKNEGKNAEIKPFYFTADQLKSMDVKTDKLQKKFIQPVIYATGKTFLVPNSEAIISSNISGKIERILVEEGDDVKEGQPLVVISSIELIELQQSYVNAKNEVAHLALEYDREVGLRKKNIGSLAEYQQVESKYRIAQNAEESIGEKLKLLGLNLENYKKEKPDVKNKINIVSPLNGSVFKLNVIRGMRVDPSIELAEIINVSRFRAEVSVYEKDIDQLSIGQEAEIEFVNQSIPALMGKVIHIIKSIDPETHAVPVIIDFTPPRNSNILPGMAIKLKITGKKGIERRFAVPISALIQEGELYFIFYGTSSNEGYVFKKAKVSLGENDGVYTEIKLSEVLPDNAVIVTENPYVINAENKKRGQ